MKKFTINMSTEDSNALQRAQYEYDTVFDLVSRNINNPNDYWTQKLVESGMSLQLLKDEITSKYVAPQVDNGKLAKTSWNADFLNQIIQVTIND